MDGFWTFIGVCGCCYTCMASLIATMEAKDRFTKWSCYIGAMFWSVGAIVLLGRLF